METDADPDDAFVLAERLVAADAGGGVGDGVGLPSALLGLVAGLDDLLSEGLGLAEVLDADALADAEADALADADALAEADADAEADALEDADAPVEEPVFPVVVVEPGFGTPGKMRVAPKNRDQLTGDTFTTSPVDGAWTMYPPPM